MLEVTSTANISLIVDRYQTSPAFKRLVDTLYDFEAHFHGDTRGVYQAWYLARAMLLRDRQARQQDQEQT
jgi:hypothetical protein